MPRGSRGTSPADSAEGPESRPPSVAPPRLRLGPADQDDDVVARAGVLRRGRRPLSRWSPRPLRGWVVGAQHRGGPQWPSDRRRGGVSVHEVTFPSADPRTLARRIAPDRVESLIADGETLRAALTGAAVVSVNSTATGGGVAEMLQVLLPYVRGAGIDTRWLVIDGDEEFFAITKRLHNHLYGTAGDGGPLSEAEHAHYEAVLRDNAAALAAVVRPGDVVLLHDPQPAGMAAAVASAAPGWSGDATWAWTRPTTTPRSAGSSCAATSSRPSSMRTCSPAGPSRRRGCRPRRCTRSRRRSTRSRRRTRT